MTQVAQGHAKPQTGKVVYTARTGAGENGAARSSDGRLDVTSPAHGASAPTRSRLFAAGWSACFESAMSLPPAKGRSRYRRTSS